MKIYEVIKEDHEIQRNLCSKLLETVGDSDERKELWKELRKELEVHEVAEERHFYKPLIDTDQMQEDARHGMAEHHEIDELIEKLEELDMSSSQWKITMEELSHKVDHHLEDEEEDFFKKSLRLRQVVLQLTGLLRKQIAIELRLEIPLNFQQRW